jgi:creatinine deaminase
MRKNPKPRKSVDAFLSAAVTEARKGLAEGGIPIGSVLVIGGKIVGAGHNRRIQKKSATLHAEMDCLESAGRLRPEEYRHATLYSTLSPCAMCSGAILLYKIPRVVVGENRNFKGPQRYLTDHGVALRVLQDPRCIALMRDFIRNHPELWNEDIGEAEPRKTRSHGR